MNFVLDLLHDLGDTARRELASRKALKVKVNASIIDAKMNPTRNSSQADKAFRNARELGKRIERNVIYYPILGYAFKDQGSPLYALGTVYPQVLQERDGHVQPPMCFISDTNLVLEDLDGEICVILKGDVVIGAQDQVVLGYVESLFAEM